MSVFPKAKFSIVDFSTRYSSEESCRELFFWLRFPHGVVCPHCGGTQLGTVRTRGLYRCKSCRKQISATSGTVFSRDTYKAQSVALGDVSVHGR